MCRSYVGEVSYLEGNDVGTWAFRSTCMFFETIITSSFRIFGAGSATSPLILSVNFARHISKNSAGAKLDPTDMFFRIEVCGCTDRLI